ncbi:MAG: hypothetical protein ABEI99_06675 [Halobaculum sp.]
MATLAGVFITGCVGVTGRTDRSVAVTASSIRVEAAEPVSARITAKPAAITADHTATLAVTTVWEGSARLTFETGHGVLASPAWSSPDGTVLVHTDHRVQPASDDGWVAERVAVPGGQEPPVSLAPGEARTDEYRLWADGDHADRLGPGTYTFAHERALTVGDRSVTAGVRVELTLAEA